MTTTTPTAAPASSVPPLGSELLRARQLRLMKRRATVLLGLVTLAFLVLARFGGTASWTGYALAAAEGAMVGGLADWFAVTALFRHPLGIPIPHTAIVVERKEQFAATLGQFVQESFLTPEVIVDRVRAAAVVPRVAAWLTDPANASVAAAEVARNLVSLVDFAPDEDVHRGLENLLLEGIEAVPVAPLAGRALRFVTLDGRHDEVLDAALGGLDHYLADHGNDLRVRLGAEAPWWLPGAIEDRIFERLLDGARAVLRDMATDPQHHLRRALDVRLVQLADDLEQSAELRERGEQLKHDLLTRAEVREWVATLWLDAKERLRVEAADESSALRARLTAALMAAGRRLQDDPAARATVESALEDAVGYAAEHFHGEISDLISGTIERWDAEETSRRLELLLGPDLQYIRINGTVVGAAAGLVLHGIVQVIA
jgi:uncharacterized membrane-anchored protein YjiN (DUF445 family)